MYVLVLSAFETPSMQVTCRMSPADESRVHLFPPTRCRVTAEHASEGRSHRSSLFTGSNFRLSRFYCEDPLLDTQERCLNLGVTPGCAFTFDVDYSTTYSYRVFLMTLPTLSFDIPEYFELRRSTKACIRSDAIYHSK